MSGLVMKHSLPPLTWFRAFEAAARTLSFTAAGEEIGLTQSAVSQQIKSLETRLKTQLFTRKARGLTLTDTGRKLLPEVEAALNTLARATERHLGASSSDQLVVAASISMIEWVIGPRLPDFQAAHPGAHISFQATIWPDEFAAPRADVELRFGSEKQVGAGAETLPMELLAVRSSALAGSLEDLPLIETIGTSVGWKDWQAQTGRRLQTPSVMVDSYGSALKLAIDGCGVALVNQVIARDALDRQDVIPAAAPTVTGHEGYFLLQRSETPLSQAFVTWLRSLVGEGAA